MSDTKGDPRRGREGTSTSRTDEAAASQPSYGRSPRPVRGTVPAAGGGRPWPRASSWLGQGGCAAAAADTPLWKRQQGEKSWMSTEQQSPCLTRSQRHKVDKGSELAWLASNHCPPQPHSAAEDLLHPRPSSPCTLISIVTLSCPSQPMSLALQTHGEMTTGAPSSHSSDTCILYLLCAGYTAATCCSLCPVSQ